MRRAFILDGRSISGEQYLSVHLDYVQSQKECHSCFLELKIILISGVKNFIRWPIITARPIRGSSKLPLSLNVYCCDLYVDNFDLIYKKYV